MDILAEYGFRSDGRRASELRQIRCKLDVCKQADGSAYISHGNTKVLATVFGPHELTSRSRARAPHDRAFINTQFSAATFSSGERAWRPHGDRKSLELSAHLAKTFETVIRTDLYPHTQIDVFVEVVEQDGATLAACVNASTLALIDAGVAMRDFVTAVNVGYSSTSESALADVNYGEEARGVRLTIGVMPRTEEIVLMELTSRVHAEQLERMIDVGRKACGDVHRILEQEVRGELRRKATLLGVAVDA